MYTIDPFICILLIHLYTIDPFICILLIHLYVIDPFIYILLIHLYVILLIGVPAKEIHLCGESTVIPLIQRLVETTNDTIEVSHIN